MRRTIIPFIAIAALAASAQSTPQRGAGEPLATAERFLVSNMWEAVPARDVKPEFIAGTDRFWYV